MKMKDVKISNLISFTQFIIIIFVFVIGITNYLSLDYIFKNTESSYNHPIKVKEALSTFKEDVLNIRLSMKEVVLDNNITESQNTINSIHLSEQDALEQIDILESSYLGPPSDVSYTKELFLDYNSICSKTIDLLYAGELEAATQNVKFNGECGIQAALIIDAAKIMETFSTNKAEELYSNSLQQKNQTSLILILLISGAIISTSAILILLRKNISIPIKKLRYALDNYDQGNTDIRVSQTSKNELGQISTSFNLMAERIEKDAQDKIAKAVELHAAQTEISIQAELIKTQTAYYIDKQLFQATLKSIGDAVISCDTKGSIIFINWVAANLTGWSPEDAINQPIENVFNIASELTHEKCENIIEKVVSSGELSELENHTILISKSGSEIPIEDSAAPIFQENGSIVGVVLVFRDVTDKRLKLKNIEHLSYHDELTGLYNRRFYEEEMERLDTERNIPLTIIMGDVNGLKLINDSLGHQSGDELLQKVAVAIKQGCRADDIIARLGGDEFIAILPNTDNDEAIVIINRIKNIALNEEVNCLPISISFGRGTKESKEQDIQEIFKKAEDDMYRQKLYESASMRSKTVDLIMNALFEKNIRESLHSKRVSELCEACSKKMKFDHENINQIRLAGLMHDIGKIGINEVLINKIEKITNEEFDEIKKHPEIGYRILNSVQEFSEISTFVLNHHERWDGKGYPKGLNETEISIQGRIIALADSFDAMIRERTYKKTLSVEEAIEEIRRCAGTQFDPNITETFIEVILEQKNSI